MMNRIVALLGDEAESLLNHQCETIAKEAIHLPSPDVVTRDFAMSDRNL